MRKFVLPLSIVILGVIIASLHSVAMERFLYFYFPWFDLLMHFLGGLLVSLFGIWFFTSATPLLSRVNSKELLANIFLFTLVVGLLWESFELFFKLQVSDQYGFFTDTSADLLMSLIGAVLGFGLVQQKNIFNRMKTTEHIHE